MKSKIYKILLGLLVLILIFLAFAFYKIKSNRDMLGSYVFADVISDMGNISHIVISQDEKDINLELKDSLWRVKEAGGYFANYILLNQLFTDVYNSQYNNVIKNVGDGLLVNPINLSFFDNKSKIIESVVIGKKDNKYMYSFAKKGNDISIITGVFNLPVDVLSWMQQPTFSFAEEDVMFMQIVDAKGVSKEVSFANSLMFIRDYMFNPVFENAIDEASFSKEEIVDTKQIILTSFDGLVTDFTIFYKDGQYWTLLKISTNNFPTIEAKAYVENNAFLYEGWYLKLPNKVGDLIFRNF